MGYADKKAKGRDADLTNVTGDLPSSIGATQSNQERATGKGTRNVGASTSKYPTGNQLRMAGNVKGTGTLKQPTAIALSGKKQTKPAVENPDGAKNRPGKF